MEHPLLLTVISGFLGYVAFLMVSSSLVKRRANPYGLSPLPGIGGDFLIGNLRQNPVDTPWLRFTELYKSHGLEFVNLQILGQQFVTVNTYEHANEMLNKRGIYSGRPTVPMIGQLMGWDQMIPLSPYGDRWRKARKIAHTSLNKVAATQFWPFHEKHCGMYLNRLLDSPGTYIQDFKLASGQSILISTYGISIRSRDDPFIKIPETAIQNMVKESGIGTHWVDFFPPAKHLPSWFPGAGFKRLATKLRLEVEQMGQAPFTRVKQDIAAGTAIASITSAHLEETGGDEEKEELLKWAAASMYIGGTDTTVSSLGTFFLAMVLHPDAVKAAQAEIDSVVGSDRLPTYSDRSQLPYVNAILKEVLRWHPVVPLGIVRTALEDDVYQGHFIPKDTIVQANAWAMAHDENMYPNPDSFSPERFLTPNKEGKLPRDPALYVFGFGRRICPGMHFADASLFITMASILAVFNVSKALDEEGHEITPPEAYTNLGVNYPKPFKCRIEPRSAAAVALIRAANCDDD